MFYDRSEVINDINESMYRTDQETLLEIWRLLYGPYLSVVNGEFELEFEENK